MANFEYEQNKSPFPTRIETENLVLKHLNYKEVSVQQLYELYRQVDEQSTQYTTFSPYEQPIEAKEFIDDSINNFENGKTARYTIELRNEEHEEPFIGTTGFVPDWERSIAESYIFLLKEYWGNGISTERGEAMLELAFEEFNMEIWESKCYPENERSIGAIKNYVVENGGRRVGVLPNEGLFDGERYDLLYFVLTQEQYKKSK